MLSLKKSATIAPLSGKRAESSFCRSETVLADGENILSKNCYNEWEYYDGTTYATVIVSALSIKGIVDEGASTPNEIKEYVIKKARNQSNLKNYVRYGIVE